MRRLEQIQADLQVVIRESILGDLRQPEAGRLVDALREERSAYGPPFHYRREDVVKLRRPLSEIIEEVS